MIKLKRTGRRFLRGEFKDLYGEPCSIQESSLAGKAAIWLGCEHETVHSTMGTACGARMHLDRKLAAQLVGHLQRFIETGKLGDAHG